MALRTNGFISSPVRLLSSQKMLKLLTHTHRLPPREPVISYHWMLRVLCANAFPSTSHGQEISAACRYHFSQAIQRAARKM